MVGVVCLRRRDRGTPRAWSSSGNGDPAIDDRPISGNVSSILGKRSGSLRLEVDRSRLVGDVLGNVGWGRGGWHFGAFSPHLDILALEVVSVDSSSARRGLRGRYGTLTRFSHC